MQPIVDKVYTRIGSLKNSATVYLTYKNGGVDMNIEITNRLYNLRKRHGFSHEEPAEKIGVSRQVVLKRERSESFPGTDALLSLSKVYR